MDKKLASDKSPLDKTLPRLGLAVAGIAQAILADQGAPMSLVLKGIWGAAGALILLGLLWETQMSRAWKIILSIAAAAVIAWPIYYLGIRTVTIEIGAGSPFFINTADGRMWVRVRLKNPTFSEATCELDLEKLLVGQHSKEMDMQLLPGGPPVDPNYVTMNRENSSRVGSAIQYRFSATKLTRRLNYCSKRLYWDENSTSASWHIRTCC